MFLLIALIELWNTLWSTIGGRTSFAMIDKLAHYLSKKLFPSNAVKGVIGSLEYNLWLAQLAGYPFSESLNPLLKNLYFVVLLVAETFYTYFELQDLRDSFTNINDFTKNACLTINHMCLLMKNVNLMRKFKEVNSIMNELRRMTKKYVVNEAQKKAFQRLELENKIPLTIYALIIVVTGFLIIFMLLADAQLERKIFPFMVKIPTVIPFSVRAVYINIVLFAMGLQIAAVDYLAITFMNQLRFQVIFLNLSLEELGEDDFEKRHQQLPENRLVTCVIHHTEILDLHKRVVDAFSIPSLIQLLTSLLTFALTGYQASTAKSDIMDGVLVYCFVGAIFVQLLVYCWFGNELMKQSNIISQTIYNSKWYEYSPRYRQYAIIFLQNTQNCIFFSAGDLVVLSLETFSNVLTKSYSFIAVMGNLK